MELELDNVRPPARRPNLCISLSLWYGDKEQPTFLTRSAHKITQIFHICKHCQVRRRGVFVFKCHQVPYANNEGDTLLVVSPLLLHQSTRQRYILKTKQELVYVHSQRFSLELHTWTLNGAIIKCVSALYLSSETRGLLEHVVCASVFSMLLWKSLGSQQTPAFHYGERSRQENQESASGRGRSTEL
jgi:hypothetical protein